MHIIPEKLNLGHLSEPDSMLCLGRHALTEKHRHLMLSLATTLT